MVTRWNSSAIFKDLDINSELGQRIRNDTYSRKVMKCLEQIGRGAATPLFEIPAVEVSEVEEDVEAIVEATETIAESETVPDAPADIVEEVPESISGDEAESAHS